MKILLLLAASFLMSLPTARAKSRAANGAYVQTMGGPSFLYARCLPEALEGCRGTTTIYRVKKEGDEVVDTYPWYSHDGVILGWSPIAGKVAVMSLREVATTVETQIEFAFHLGGKQLHAYTTSDLGAMGIAVGPSFEGVQAQYQVIGCVQVPQTNEYDFVIEAEDGTRFTFDILTGKRRVS